MEKFFRFTDEKSDKYWEAACNDLNLTIFFGKIHSAGRVEEKTFETKEKCIQEYEKLIKSKLKKGYVETIESNRPIHNSSTLNLIRDFEENNDIKVSPISKKLMNEDFYWSCVEETSPFGSDEGSDTFSFLREAFQDNPRTKPIDFLNSQFLSNPDFYPLRDLNCLDSDFLKKNFDDSDLLIIQDNAIWAVAFGQLVIRGHIDEEVISLAKISLKRQLLDVFKPFLNKRESQIQKNASCFGTITLA
ncbi:MAG: WGR domain-containing protein [Cytophagaceae bacterium]|nr:WGR domain-containing protein [Cytophagaceae bacterium]